MLLLPDDKDIDTRTDTYIRHRYTTLEYIKLK